MAWHRFGSRRPAAALMASIQLVKALTTSIGPKRRQAGALQGVVATDDRAWYPVLLLLLLPPAPASFL